LKQRRRLGFFSGINNHLRLVLPDPDYLSYLYDSP